ncbi:MAG: hypothetical protein L5656_04880 [Thermanaeromonas sp.]|uniref:hypothetical protein n=1 Tax=Thermanaeromonas sp. TaxID=2003697 RepID=UPI00243B627F|nr:hypothetical protein [Thermanaeromonas sp.]MCG0277845.1 hypothetical protein [Thermanaeromonas sp.]
MHWTDNVRKVLELDEEELALWSRIAAAEHREGMRSLIQAMIDNEKKDGEELRELLRKHTYMDP